MLSLSDVRRAGNSVGRAFLLFSLLSPAMFGASCAFLPSSFSMALNALAMALWLREKWFLSTFLTASSADPHPCSDHSSIHPAHPLNTLPFTFSSSDHFSIHPTLIILAESSFSVELKAGEGHVYEGMLRGGQNAVATVRVDDADFVKLIGGQLDATRNAPCAVMCLRNDCLHRRADVRFLKLRAEHPVGVACSHALKTVGRGATPAGLNIDTKPMVGWKKKYQRQQNTKQQQKMVGCRRCEWWKKVEKGHKSGQQQQWKKDEQKK
ncbi:hypothetical protein GPALN_001806 [Globodera pallida]|nr:hypothetical protein GPALN_001806 [Globodera pallida]